MKNYEAQKGNLKSSQIRAHSWNKTKAKNSQMVTQFKKKKKGTAPTQQAQFCYQKMIFFNHPKVLCGQFHYTCQSTAGPVAGQYATQPKLAYDHP